MQTNVDPSTAEKKRPELAPALSKNSTSRDALMTVLSIVLVLLTLTFAFFHFRETGERPKPGNVTGVVIEKVFTPAPEQQITYGSKGLKEEQIAGGYVLRVRVKAENRTYDVPVDKRFYEARSVGDPLTFMLPASEGQ